MTGTPSKLTGAVFVMYLKEGQLKKIPEYFVKKTSETPSLAVFMQVLLTNNVNMFLNAHCFYGSNCCYIYTLVYLFVCF